jgi:hypothetical protein
MLSLNRLHSAQDHNVADGGIAQKVVRNLDCDFPSRSWLRVCIALPRIYLPLVFRSVGGRLFLSALLAAELQMSRILCAASRLPSPLMSSSQIAFGLLLWNQRIATPLGDDVKA